MDIMTLVQDYQLYIIGAVIVVIIGCFKSEEFRNWVIRLIVFALIIGVCAFGFQKIKYRFKSGNEVNHFNEEAEESEHAGKKYYRDPDTRMENNGSN